MAWSEKKSKEKILRTAHNERKFVCRIRKRQAEFLGHVMGKGKHSDSGKD